MNKAITDAEKCVSAREKYGIESPPEVLKAVTELARDQAVELEQIRPLIVLVAQMREAQARFFSQRTDGWFREAKKLEKKLDEAIRDYLERKNRPRSLPFDKGGADAR